MSAGDVRSKIRLYIQVMDRDKEKAIKLGTLLRGSIPLTSLKVLEGSLPTEEEMSGSSGKRKKKSKSELECEVVAKKKAAGDLILDIRLKPSESMSAAGAMLIELFRVVEGLIDSPLRCRWTAAVYQSNVNKVQSIIDTVDACMNHWMVRVSFFFFLSFFCSFFLFVSLEYHSILGLQFLTSLISFTFLLLFTFFLFCCYTQFASLLASAEGGGVSTHQLEEAKFGLNLLLDGLQKRKLFEECADERREEEERKERILQEESDRRKRLREEERARRPGSRGASRGKGGGRGSSSSMNTKSLGSKHADFVEMKVHGLV